MSKLWYQHISTQGWDAVATTVEQGQRIIYLETQRLVLNSFIEMTWNRKTLIDQRLTAPRYKILRHRHVCGANFPPTHRAQADVEANWLQIAIFANEKVVCATLVHHLAITSGKQHYCPVGIQHGTLRNACNPYRQIDCGGFVPCKSSSN